MKSFINSWLFIFIFLIAIICTWIVGLTYFFPYRFWWFDVIMHFFGGLWVLSFILKLKNHYRIAITGEHDAVVSFFVLVGLVVLVGVLWEFAEFVSDRYILKTGFTHLRGVYEDTLKDLLMDVIGGGAGAIICLLCNKKTNA